MSADNCGCDPDIAYTCERHQIEALQQQVRLLIRAYGRLRLHAGVAAAFVEVPETAPLRQILAEQDTDRPLRRLLVGAQS